MSSQGIGGFQPAVFSVNVLAIRPYSDNLKIVFGGTGYVQNDVILVPGARFGGSNASHDLRITLTTVVNGTITDFTSTGASASVVPLTFFTIPNRRNTPTITTRDSSDYTRELKERLLYNEFQDQVNKPKLDRRGGVNSAGPGAAGTLWEQQSNQVRLSYLFGRRKCRNCAGGDFNSNGVRNFNSNGVQQGS